MEMRERAEFVRTWGSVVFRSERDRAFADRLHTDPRAVLTEAGLPLRPEAAVVVERVAAEGLELDRHVELYAAGQAGGAYTFLVPTEAPVPGR
ncbi:MAG: hypothetical protein WBP61_04100 [Nocardioides sp.]